jgi:nucleotide-binding universal stress UspA family protein
MKAKPAGDAGGVVLELSPKESQLPAQPQPAFQIKKILVPVDFSECSHKALQYAVPFAKQFNAELILLHVVDITPLAPELGYIEAQGIPDSRKRLIDLQQSLDRSISSRTLLRTGASYFKISEVAAECQADLIIISTHGRTGVPRILLGSTTERVVRHAPCPVLIVRESEHEFIQS